MKAFVFNMKTIFDRATNEWYYASTTGRDIPDNILSILESNTVPVYKSLSSKTNDCGIMSSVWAKIFRKNGIKTRIVDGNYNPQHKPGISHPSSTDHVWLELDNDIIFDPTAGQFGSDISNKNYWIDSETRAYSDTIDEHVRVYLEYITKQTIKEDFGKELFGQQLNRPKKNPEPNTEPEDDLANDLSNHYGGDMSDLSPWIPQLVKLNKVGKYKNVLRVPSKYKYAYRVMGNIRLSTLTKMLGYEPTDFEPEEVYHEDNAKYSLFDYQTHSSWTVDFDVIKKIFDDWSLISHGIISKEQEFFVILRAPVNSNTFLLNPDVTGFLSKHFDYQREIISVGNVRCDKIWYVPYHMKSMPKDDLYINKIHSVK